MTSDEQNATIHGMLGYEVSECPIHHMFSCCGRTPPANYTHDLQEAVALLPIMLQAGQRITLDMEKGKYTATYAGRASGNTHAKTLPLLICDLFMTWHSTAYPIPSHLSRMGTNPSPGIRL